MMNPRLHEDLATYIDWQNIAGNTLKDLRSVCAERNLPVPGRRHEDYVVAVTAYYQAVTHGQGHAASSTSRQAPRSSTTPRISGRSSASNVPPCKDVKFLFSIVAVCASLLYLAWVAVGK
jgi:hypothetical protein